MIKTALWDKLPPAWKVKRELLRVRDQITDFYEGVWDPVRGRIWKSVGQVFLRETQGNLAWGPNVALYLIFPIGGVPESLIKSLDHLVSKGFVPVIVSNTPISGEDKKRLQDRSCLIVERPNVGYDFGGYHDGIRLIQRKGIEPDNFLVLNDSIWFPVAEPCDLIDRMMASPAGYVGVTDGYYFGLRGAKDRFDDSGKLHICSFMFMLRKSVFQSHAFQSYWNKYQPRSIKQTVVRDGEVGFYEALMEANVESDVMYSKADILQDFKKMEPEEVANELFRLIGTARKCRKEWGELVENRKNGGQIDEDYEREFLFNTVRTVNTFDCLAFEGIRRYQFPILKKAILRKGKTGEKERFLHYLKEDGVYVDPVILDEIRT